MKRFGAAAAGAVVLAAALAWYLLRDTSTDQLRPPDDLDAATAAIARAVPGAQAENHVPTVTVAVSRDGAPLWSRVFGAPDGTVFEAGSISKTVTAAVVLTLVGDGTLDLDTPVSTYLHDWRLPADFAHPDDVTLRRLLSHTAGIDTPGYLGIAETRTLPTTAESLDGAATGDAVRQSQKVGHYAYSGGGFTIVQEVVEQVTGEPFADVARRTVLDPLGMNASGYDCTQRAAAGPAEATGHLADGTPAPRYRYAEAAAAGLCTTGADLGRLAGWLSSGDPRAKQMRHPQSGTEGAYGLGLELDHDTVHHPGVNRGFHAELWVDVPTRTGLVVLTDGDGGGPIAQVVLDAFNGS